jgi:hypothetical protein
MRASNSQLFQMHSQSLLSRDFELAVIYQREKIAFGIIQFAVPLNTCLGM